MLYAEAAKQGVTTITISQRNTLPEFHTQHLNLGENVHNGWSLKEVSPIALFTYGTHKCCDQHKMLKISETLASFVLCVQIEAGQKNVVASAI